MSLPRDTRRWPSTRIGQEHVICDDRDFHLHGQQGFDQLHDSINGWAHPIGLEPLPQGGGLYLTLQIKDGSKYGETTCEANKRLNLVATTVDEEYWWAWGSWYGVNGLRNVEFSLDQAQPDGTRRYPFGYRWAHYSSPDGGSTWTRTNKLQVADTSGGSLVYSDLPGSPTYDAAFNENKGDMNYFRGRFDIANFKYLGCIFGRQGYGCFDLGDGNHTVDWTGQGNTAPLAGYNPPSGADVSFANGMNAAISMSGRLDTTQNYSKVWVSSHRTIVVAGDGHGRG